MSDRGFARVATPLLALGVACAPIGRSHPSPSAGAPNESPARASPAAAGEDSDAHRSPEGAIGEAQGVYLLSTSDEGLVCERWQRWSRLPFTSTELARSATRRTAPPGFSRTSVMRSMLVRSTFHLPLRFEKAAIVLKDPDLSIFGRIFYFRCEATFRVLSVTKRAIRLDAGSWYLSEEACNLARHEYGARAFNFASCSGAFDWLVEQMRVPRMDPKRDIAARLVRSGHKVWWLAETEASASVRRCGDGWGGYAAVRRRRLAAKPTSKASPNHASGGVRL